MTSQAPTQAELPSPGARDHSALDCHVIQIVLFEIGRRWVLRYSWQVTLVIDQNPQGLRDKLADVGSEANAVAVMRRLKRIKE
jgi:hypothetical protein